MDFEGSGLRVVLPRPLFVSFPICVSIVFVFAGSILLFDLFGHSFF